MPTIYPTTPEFRTIIAPVAHATQAAPRTTVTMDLRNSFEATLMILMGREAATALTRPAKVGVRRTDNGSRNLPAGPRDCFSSTAAVTRNTVASGGAGGTTSVTLASGTGFAANDNILIQTAGTNVEFCTLSDVTTNTLTIDRSTGFRLTHAVNEVVTNGVDYFEMSLPGGDIWEITPTNNSGQTIIFLVEAIIQHTMTSAA